MGNDPNNKYYGRHLVGVNVDGGSFQCPEKTSAAAKTIANDIRPFADLHQLRRFAPYNMAAGLNAAAPRRPQRRCTSARCGCPTTTTASAATTTPAAPASRRSTGRSSRPGTTIVNQYASYVCGRLVGGKATRSPNANIAGKKRVFGFVHPNGEQDP